MGPRGPGVSRRVRAAHQLPRGRHGLSRDHVQADQRQRILDAVADVSSLAGYQAMSIAGICVDAGVSRRTFYDLYSGKEEAFLAAYDAVAARLTDELRAAARGADTFAAGGVACLRAFLELARAALPRRTRVMEALAALLQTGARTVANGSRPPQLIAQTLIGGIYEAVYARVLSGSTNELPGLLRSLSYSILLPYLAHQP